VIVRILGEGQYQLDDAGAARLTPLDADLTAAVERNDERSFTAALDGAVKLVRSVGAPVPADSLAASDVILPALDASLEDVRRLLAEDGITLG
jgi:hypothetical protein